jgi:hypothetical protein
VALSGTIPKAWRFQIAGIAKLAAVEGGDVTSDPLGAVIQANPGEKRLRLTVA